MKCCLIATFILLIARVGAITAAALNAEQYLNKITVFERRETAGGTWYKTPFNLA